MPVPAGGEDLRGPLPGPRVVRAESRMARSLGGARAALGVRPGHGARVFRRGDERPAAARYGSLPGRRSASRTAGGVRAAAGGQRSRGAGYVPAMGFGTGAAVASGVGGGRAQGGPGGGAARPGALGHDPGPDEPPHGRPLGGRSDPAGAGSLPDALRTGKRGFPWRGRGGRPAGRFLDPRQARSSRARAAPRGGFRRDRTGGRGFPGVSRPLPLDGPGHRPHHGAGHQQRAGLPGPEGGEGPVRGRHARQERLSGLDEPRDPHPHERGHRHDPVTSDDGSFRGAAALRRGGADRRGGAAGPDRRHPGLVEGRVGQAHPGGARFRRAFHVERCHLGAGGAR